MEESFEELLEGTLYERKEGLVKAVVVKKLDDGIFIDLGIKAEKFIPKAEFFDYEWGSINVNDEIDVVIDGSIVSYKEARRKKAFQDIYNAYKNGSPISIVVKNETKGGYIADYKGFQIFIPGSQAKGSKSVKEGEVFNAIVKKIENRGNNIVCSIFEYENYLKEKSYENFFNSFKEKDIIEGEVKGIIDKGVFVLFNGVEGFIPFSELTYKRIKSPGEFLNIGDRVRAKIIRLEKDNKKVTLSTKALEKNPFEVFVEKYREGDKLEGIVRNIIDKGVFVEIIEGLDGFIPVSEISWTERVKNPQKYFKIGDRISVLVKNIDKKNLKISLSFKDLINNPWEDFGNSFPVGSVVKVVIKEFVDKGVVVKTSNDLEAFIPNEYLGYGKVSEEKKRLKKGQSVDAKIINLDPERRRIILSIKDLLEDPFNLAMTKIKVGDEVEAKVSGVTENIVFFEIMPEIEGIVKRREFKKDSQIKIGDSMTLLVTGVDEGKRKFLLSLEELIKRREKKDLEEHKSKNTVSVTLGDYFKR